MAKESVEILKGKLDVENLISQLNAALSEEWLAYYQYWVGALVVEGAMRANVQSEFEEHAEEERKHAQMLAKRIIELNDYVASVRWAFLRYQEFADFTNVKDFTTCDIVKKILAEEEEHEQDLQDYLTDIDKMKKSLLENEVSSNS